MRGRHRVSALSGFSPYIEAGDAPACVERATGERLEPTFADGDEASDTGAQLGAAATNENSAYLPRSGEL